MVDGFIESEMLKRHIPGLSAAVIRNGKPVLMKGYGLANVELSVAATQHSVYEIASITKVFTATAVMLFIEEGRLSLGTEIADHLDGLPDAWRGVTIQHLLTHTSGIKNYTDVADYWKTTRLDISRDEIMKLVSESPLQFRPGEKWAYSNTGYYLLGFLIEKLSGKTYGEFLSERIFRPLGMSSTQVNNPAVVIKDRAAGYTWRDDVLHNKEYYSTSGTYAAGVLLSSVADLAKWDTALYADAIVKQSTVQKMWMPGRLPTPIEQQYGFVMGLGWFSYNHRGHRVMAHNGGIKGFSSALCRFMDDKLTVIMLWNLDNFERPDELANAVAEFYLPDLAQNITRR